LRKLRRPRNRIFVVLETRLFQQCNTRVVFEKVTLYASIGTERILTDAYQKRRFVKVTAEPTANRTLNSEF